MKHGLSNSRIYHIWEGLKRRCLNPNHEAYQRYKGMLCEEWLDFNTFYKDVGDPPSPKHSLDRVDNNKGYYKENVRWATKIEQARNTSTNRILKFKGKTQCVAAWAEELGVSAAVIHSRLKKMSVAKALTIPVRPSKRLVTYRNKTQSITAWAEETGIPSYTISRRIDAGWVLEDVFNFDNGKGHLNKDNATYLKYKGETKHISEWAKEVNLTVSIIRDRLRLGWSIEDALTKPRRRSKI